MVTRLIKYATATLWFGTLLSVVLLQPTSMLAQARNANSNTDSRVQELYAEASEAKARGDFPSAVRAYEEILKLQPRLGAAYNNLGALYVQSGQYEKAADILSKGLKVKPDMRSASALLGISLFKINRFPEARAHLEAGVSASPEDIDLRLLLVDDLTRIGDFEAAARQLQKLTKDHPDNQHAWYLLAKVYSQLGQQALGKMNALDAHSVWVHLTSAELMEEMKNYDGAEVEYRKAIELAPSQSGTRYKLGDMYWSLSRWDEAREQFQAEMTSNPRNCLAQWKLGNILFQKAQFEEALDEVDKAISMCPSLADARFDRGRVLLKLRRAEEALPYLQEGAKANPSSPTPHFALSQALRALGKNDAARAELDIYTRLQDQARAEAAQQAEEVARMKAKRDETVQESHEAAPPANK